MAWFAQIGIDPYADPDQDGWSTIEEYENQSNPISWNTPSAPKGLQARYTGLTNALVTWVRPPGNIIGYHVEKVGPDIENGYFTEEEFFPTSPILQDDNAQPDEDPDFIYGSSTSYRVRAQHAGGYSQWSEWVSPTTLAAGVGCQIVRGPEGKLFVVLSGIHPATTGVRLSRYDSSVSPPTPEPFDIPLSEFTNGISPFPEEAAPLYNRQCRWYVRGLTANGTLGEASWLGERDWKAAYPFYDGREALQQNLVFQLRAANMDDDLSFYWAQGSSDAPYSIDQVWSSPDYAYSGYWDMTLPQWTPSWVAYHEEEINPHILNHLYRNFVFTFDDVTEWGFPNTGVAWQWYDIPAVVSPKYELHWPQTTAPLPVLLSAAQSEWVYAPRRDWNYIESYGLVESDNGHMLDPNARNLYGLPIVGLKTVWGNHPSAQVAIGPGEETWENTQWYLKTAEPQLETISYYFAHKSPSHPWVYGPAPVPGEPTFSVTNTTPVLVASLGDSTFQLGGWAKQRILNGYSDKFAYLGQYFENAYKIDSNGQITTNETGILSPYGEFMPLEPGPVALVTMTNWGVNERGTAIVHVISMSVDANHDGVMDLSYTGPDATVLQRPFRFWVNDDNDSGETEGNDIPGWPVAHSKVPNGSDNIVNGVRDLVDFFPMYLNIQSVLQALPSGVTCWLKHEENALGLVDPDFYSEFTISPTNCLTYLTDTNIARLIGRTGNSSFPPASVHQITASGYPLDYFVVDRIRTHGKAMLLIEARAPTTRPLVLELWQGTNFLASTEVQLSITGVEQMFRHKNLIAETFPNSNDQGGPRDRLRDSEVLNEPEITDKSFIFIHGYNVNPDQARGSFAETFKRMYWAGSQARFYGVTWFGSDTQEIAKGKTTPDYHINVDHAFETAPKLRDFLATLTNGPNTVVAHSLGNMVALSALSDWNANMSNYFMLNAAVALEAIDGGATPIAHMTHSTWVAPENYANRLYASYWWTLFPTNDARSTLTWSNRLGNFHNTDVYNFYSTGEEVLREYNDDPPVSAFGSVGLLLNFWALHPPFSSFVWVWQEKGKGVAPLDTILGSTHGGWKFNTNAPYMTNGWHMPNSQASLVPASQIQTNAFFDMSNDYLLFSPETGNAWAQQARNRILSDAIPALTWAVGSHPVPKLSPPQHTDQRNSDMNLLYQNGWPSSRQSGQEAFKWHHSDFKDVAYTFVYPLFDKFTRTGNLK